MINCAIYPRKSKANDNSQSMQQQIADCDKYIKEHYSDANIYVYDGDYALTGHSTAKRKDFQRMMNDVKAGQIQLVVIMRYDRIARNMRDFCNLYHDMEEHNCNLVSVSQQIDTSTPYGKNFMYQMAAMAELEWAIISERYKDTAKYKASKGYAYTGRLPIGFKIEKDIDGNKRVVKDNEEVVRSIFDKLLETKSKRATVEYGQSVIPNFSRHKLKTMIDSDLFIGKAHGNDHFCEPYFTEEEMSKIRALNNIKYAPSGNTYLFRGMIRCPICGYSMAGFYSSNKNPKGRIYYRCWHSNNDKPHKSKMISEQKTEAWLLDQIEPSLNSLIAEYELSEKRRKIKPKTSIAKLENQLDRINYMFEKGRLSIEDYEKKYNDISDKIKNHTDDNYSEYKRLSDIQINVSDNWKEVYMSLDKENKQLFWQNIVKQIVFDENYKPKGLIF